MRAAVPRRVPAPARWAAPCPRGVADGPSVPQFTGGLPRFEVGCTSCLFSLFGSDPGGGCLRSPSSVAEAHQLVDHMPRELRFPYKAWPGEGEGSSLGSDWTGGEPVGGGCGLPRPRN